MNLILFEASEVGPDGTATVAGARAHHIAQVLKASRGQAIRIGLVDGPTGEGEVIAVDTHSVSVKCRWASTPPSIPRIDLLLALPRPKVMQRLWAQLAAIGVGHIIITNAARVERQYFDTHVLDAGSFRPRLIEGLQQARDTRVPQVSVHRQFRALVEDDLDELAPDATRVVADPFANATPGDIQPLTRRMVVAVGPEGGWNQFELDLLRNRGFQGVTFGERTLRSDTACVVILSRMHEVLSGSKMDSRK